MTGDNGYSGGTYVDNTIVIPGCATALGTGTVTVSDERYRGGELHFDANYDGSVFGNAIVVSGNGFYHAGLDAAYDAAWGARAAVSAHDKRITLTGAVTLAGDATVATSGANGRITLAGPVGGTGTLRVTAGTVIVKKDALAAYEAGRIVAEPGAVVTPKYPTGALIILR